ALTFNRTDNITLANNISGTGSLNKTNNGSLTISGNVSVGAVNVNRAVSTGTAPALIVNGGTLTATALSTVQGATTGNTGGGFFLTSGAANFNAGLRTDANDGATIRVDGGTFTASDLTVQRNGGAAGSTGVFTNGIIF